MRWSSIVPVSRTDMGRCLGLDLLRALAILMVLASHLTGHFASWFGFSVPQLVDNLGDTGVEIFFALSGFLIGRILLGITGARPTWTDFRIFMIRRAMRTLPLYFLWLALLLCVFPPRQDVMVSALRFLTLTQNLMSDMPADYYFVVTWSLTIEEWFYLLFGAALILLSRQFGGRRALVACLTVFLITPVALRLFYVQRSPLVFFRIDEIAYGVLMARLYLDNSRVFSRPWTMLVAGLGLLSAALFSLLPWPDQFAVPLTSNIEVIGGALCLPAALLLSQGGAWFTLPVRWIASRSYALYLMHLTILVDMIERPLVQPALLAGWACAVIAIALPFLLAELSYRFLESPLLRLRPQQGALRTVVVPPAVAGATG